MLTPSPFLQEDMGGRVAANCHRTEGISRWTQRCGRSLPPHSHISLYVSSSQCPGEVWDLPATSQPPGHPPGCCCWLRGSPQGSGSPPHMQHWWSQRLQERTPSHAMSRPCRRFMQSLWLFASNGNKSHLLGNTVHYKSLLYSLYWSTFLFV